MKQLAGTCLLGSAGGTEIASLTVSPWLQPSYLSRGFQRSVEDGVTFVIATGFNGSAYQRSRIAKGCLLRRKRVRA
jgi:hypothetical protein